MCFVSAQEVAASCLLWIAGPPLSHTYPGTAHALQYRDLEAEKARAVGEKQASLESMMRAAATATREAALKQEALNNLAREMDALVREGAAAPAPHPLPRA